VKTEFNKHREHNKQQDRLQPISRRVQISWHRIY